MADRIRLIAWAERHQEQMLADAIQQADLELIAIGSPSTATADALSKRFGVGRVDDLRQAIQHKDVDLLWVAAPDRIDGDERRLIRELGLQTISNEPRPVEVSDLIRNPDEAGTAIFAPLMRHSPGFRSAMDALDEFASPQSINVSSGSGPGAGTLFARLFDAMDLIDALCGQAEGVDASMAGPLQAVPKSLANLHGHMTVNLRFADDCCACVSVSDCAGSWFRRATVIGAGGRLHITDGGCEWVGSDGEPIETGSAGAAYSPGELIGMQISRLLERLDAAPQVAPPNTTRLLALCEAARLSCRTRQGETPQMLLDMLSKL